MTPNPRFQLTEEGIEVLKIRWMAGVFAALVLAAVLLGVSPASAAGVTKDVRFAPGTSGAVIEGGVVRGDRDRYYLQASAGQRISVEITSVEDNAVFVVTTPKNKLFSPQEARKFNGTLPVSGRYLIEVGGTRGNATYTLKVHIH